MAATKWQRRAAVASAVFPSMAKYSPASPRPRRSVALQITQKHARKTRTSYATKDQKRARRFATAGACEHRALHGLRRAKATGWQRKLFAIAERADHRQHFFVCYEPPPVAQLVGIDGVGQFLGLWG